MSNYIYSFYCFWEGVSLGLENAKLQKDSPHLHLFENSIIAKIEYITQKVEIMAKKTAVRSEVTNSRGDNGQP